MHKSLKVGELIFLTKLEAFKEKNDDIKSIPIVNEFVNLFSMEWMDLPPQ